MSQKAVKKLEDIPKKNIYEVPEGYFDKLPGIIQSRVAKEETIRKPFFVHSLRYAIPAMVVAIVALAVLFFRGPPDGKGS